MAAFISNSKGLNNLIKQSPILSPCVCNLYLACKPCRFAGVTFLFGVKFFATKLIEKITKTSSNIRILVECESYFITRHAYLSIDNITTISRNNSCHYINLLARKQEVPHQSTRVTLLQNCSLATYTLYIT